MDFDSGRPIYLQLAELLAKAIAAGEFQPGQRFPTVRELAAKYSVNPNTVQRTMSELERQGLLYSERTAGRFVTPKGDVISAARQDTANKLIDTFLSQMADLGFSAEEAAQLLNTRKETTHV